MDQLKQVLKYQFWILLTVALILPFVGWTMATSGLVSEAAARTSTLDGLDKSLTSGPTDPNKDWETGLEKINVEQAQQPKFAAKVLFERQLPLMVWPANMPNDPALIQPIHQELYRSLYRRGTSGQPPLVYEVRKLVNPYDEESQTGLIDYDEALLPNPDTEWVSQAPSVKQIEAAQEDLWLLSSLLTQIAAVNEDAGAKTQFEAPIRQIVELYLRGGSSKAGGGAAKPAAGGGAAKGAGMDKSMAGMGGMGGGMSGGMGGGMGGRGSGEAAAAITSPKINPDDDLGPEQAAPADKSAGDNKAAAKGPAQGMAGSMAGSMIGGMGGGMGSGPGSAQSARWSGSNMGRYRDDNRDFKTRGFYLEVVMDHRRIPELLTSLVNADWPINILHVQESDFKDEDLADASGGLAGMGGRMMGGGGGGGAMPAPMGPGGGRPPMGGGPGGMKAAAGMKPPMRAGEDGEVGSVVNTRSPLDDPNLSNVAIVGVIYIFKKPAETPGATTPGATTPPATGTVPPAAPVAAAPAGAAGAAATTGDASKGPAATTPAAAAKAEPAAAADDAKVQQPGPAPADAPEKDGEKKSENKPEAEPGAGPAPDKDGSPEKAAPEKAAKS